jgi:anti-anti-sigma regulatory factor
MNQKFQAVVHRKDDMTYVKLSGVIDEDNELTDLTDKIPGGTAVIDLSEIERINSCGVRDWVNWLGKIEKNGAKPVLVECSPAIVAQINLVNNFTGAGVVKSFFAPYFCPNCDREKVLLVEAAELGPAPHKAPTCRCDECDGVMDFDDMEDSYFAFLSTAKKVAEPGKINKVISEFAPSDGEKSKIRSRVGSTGSGVSPSQTSLPSVPSLPSISRTGSASGMGFAASGGSGITGGSASQIGMRPSFAGGGTRPGGTNPGTNPGGIGPGTKPSLAAIPAPAPPKNSKMVYILVGVLLAAIGVLGFLLFSGGAKKKSEANPTHAPAALVATK